jgi:hypothetical protein
MAADHTPFLRLAQKLIGDNGQDLTFTRKGGLFDPSEGKVLLDNNTTWKLKSVVLTFKETTAREFPKGVGEQARKMETRLLLAAPSATDVDGNPTFDPEAMDLVDYESASWQVLGVVALKPRDVTVLYKVVIGK